MVCPRTTRQQPRGGLQMKGEAERTSRPVGGSYQTSLKNQLKVKLLW
jgi:hypothetical protein